MRLVEVYTVRGGKIVELDVHRKIPRRSPRCSPTSGDAVEPLPIAPLLSRQLYPGGQGTLMVLYRHTSSGTFGGGPAASIS